MTNPNVWGMGDCMIGDFASGLYSPSIQLSDRMK